MPTHRYGSLRALRAAVETDVSDRLGNTPKNQWVEDPQTQLLIKDLTKLLDDACVVGAEQIKTKIAAFKQSGTQETKFGDLCLLVKVRFRDGMEITGAAFLEAKKRDWPGNDYSMLKKEQAERISSNCRYAKLLMYDYERISTPLVESALTAISQASFYESMWLWEQRTLLWEQRTLHRTYTRVAVAPIECVARGAKDTTSLYRQAIPFSVQMCDRYLFGLELDESPNVVKAAKGHAVAESVPENLLTISVGHGGTPPPDLDGFDLNTNMLHQLGAP